MKERGNKEREHVQWRDQRDIETERRGEKRREKRGRER